MTFARSVITALRARIPVEDSMFDRLYPDHVARLSGVHWTPLSVAQRASALLAPEPGMRVLDVGAGPGKLCCVGAILRGGHWHGVERDPSLVAVAIETARALEVDGSTSFVVGDALALDWRGFDSVYLYNPFESQRFGGGFARIAGDAGVSEQVVRTEVLLAGLAPGTRVVTFHGFGGDMPADFARLSSEVAGAPEAPEAIGITGELALWIKQPARIVRE
jgi:SAM-dependent methyltransferase